MKTLRKIGKAIMDFLGIACPIMIFCVLFFSFVATIFVRYFLHKSLSWGNELAVLCYMWIMYFGCGKAIENDEHVVFSLVYDKCSPKVQMLMKVVYNVALAALLACTIPSGVTALLKSTMKTGILKIPYTICFAPFIWMLAEAIVRSLINVYKAISDYKHHVVHLSAVDQAIQDAEAEVAAEMAAKAEKEAKA